MMREALSMRSWCLVKRSAGSDSNHNRKNVDIVQGPTSDISDVSSMYCIMILGNHF
jgi:hypothetical protein